MSGERRALSEREIEVVQLIADGHRNKEIAEKLFISTHTVRSHIHRAELALGARDRANLVLLAMREGLVT